MIAIAKTLVIYSGPPEEEVKIQTLFQNERDYMPHTVRNGVWLFHSNNVAQMLIAAAKKAVRTGTLHWATIEESELRRWPDA